MALTRVTVGLSCSACTPNKIFFRIFGVSLTSKLLVKRRKQPGYVHAKIAIKIKIFFY